MRILVVGLNLQPEPVGIGPYTSGLVRALTGAGHRVTVIAGKPYYPTWRADPAYAGPLWHRSREDGADIVRCTIYVPARPGGIGRLIHHASYALSALIPAVRAARRLRPDLVIAIAPSLIATPVARIAARVAGARLLLHIQDFEVEAALATGLLASGGIAARAARAFERGQLRAADIVSTISPHMCAKLAEKGVAPDRIVEFRNWANIDTIRPEPGGSRYRDEWNIATPHVALYSGNLANKQGVEIVADAARRMRDRDDLTFVICGNGPTRAALEASVADLPNVRVADLQPVERLSELLSLASVHLLPQIAGAADLVLPSKLANMLASGRPVVATAAPGTGLAAEVEGCGIVTPPERVEPFCAAIATLLDDDALRRRMGEAARERAVARWSREAILQRFVDGLGTMARIGKAR